MQAIEYARSRASWAPAIAFLGAMLALAALGSRPAAAAPFAYVTNNKDKTVSVIATATNTVVGSR